MKAGLIDVHFSDWNLINEKVIVEEYSFSDNKIIDKVFTENYKMGN